jgi:hypothetical protein
MNGINLINSSAINENISGGKDMKVTGPPSGAL